jgi:hypothetical protein
LASGVEAALFWISDFDAASFQSARMPAAQEQVTHGPPRRGHFAPFVDLVVVAEFLQFLVKPLDESGRRSAPD